MGENSKIEWTHHTFNPWIGCTKVSPACDHCYAESWAKRSGAVVWDHERIRTAPANWKKPLKWQRDAAAAGERRRVFCASLADVFDNQAPSEWRDDLWDLIEATPDLDWLLLTKRIGNVKNMVPWYWGPDWPRNVQLGISICDQPEADRDIPKLLILPAKIRFLSCEPLLGPIDLERGGFTFLRRQKSPAGVQYEAVNWVIVGGESGSKARPCEWEWLRSLRDQCQSAGVAFFMKQLSQAGRSWFKDFDAFPPDLQIREWPTS